MIYSKMNLFIWVFIILMMLDVLWELVGVLFILGWLLMLVWVGNKFGWVFIAVWIYFLGV